MPSQSRDCFCEWGSRSWLMSPLTLGFQQTPNYYWGYRHLETELYGSACKCLLARLNSLLGLAMWIHKRILIIWQLTLRRIKGPKEQVQAMVWLDNICLQALGQGYLSSALQLYLWTSVLYPSVHIDGCVQAYHLKWVTQDEYHMPMHGCTTRKMCKHYQQLYTP